MSKPMPNLFAYATSELSQDAFLSWFLAWADDTYTGELHDYGRRFLGSLFAKCGHTLPNQITVEVKKQYLHIDVLVVVNDKFYVIIEDKTGTCEHDDQLGRYKCSITDNLEGKGIEILPIYLRFENQSDYKRVHKAGYSVYSRHDFLSLFADFHPNSSSYESARNIFENYIEHIRQIDAEYESFKTLSVDKWESCSRTWKGFYSWIQSEFSDAQWDYVPNPSGGFIGCWLDWSGLASDIGIYVQLEEYKSCFKICNESEAPNIEVRDQARRLLQKAANDIAPDRVVKPNRLGCGMYMTIACLAPEVRKFDADGKINLEKTKENIQLMIDIIAKTVELANKERNKDAN